MAKGQDNIFGAFGNDLAAREQEQARTEAIVTGKRTEEEDHPALVGRPRKRIDATSMSISISRADKMLVKRYALDHAVTVSDLIHLWINQHCVEEV